MDSGFVEPEAYTVFWREEPFKENNLFSFFQIL